MKDIKKYIAECIGTFILVFFGCGTAVVTSCSVDNLPGYLLTALAFGLAIVGMAYSVGSISGGHVNPAVSLAMLITGRMNSRDFIGYVVGQFVDAIVAAALLCLFVGRSSGLGTNGLYNGSIILSLLIELILTFVFVLLILFVTAKAENGAVAGLIIGLTLVLIHILGIYFTGTSVNPARSFGPALFAGGDALKCVWVFFVGPLVGAALAGVVYNYFEKG